MKISEFLPEEAILLEVRAKDKWSLFQEVAQILARLTGISAEKIIQLLSEREKLSTTAIGDGVAIPHSRVEGLKEIVICVVRAENGIDFDSEDKKPVRLVFVVLAPEGESQLYLQTLAHIAHIVKDPQIKKRLLAASSAKEIKEILEEVDYEY